MKTYFVCNYCWYADDSRIICSVIYQNQYSIIDVWNRLLAIIVEFLNFISMFQVCRIWFLREDTFHQFVTVLSVLIMKTIFLLVDGILLNNDWWCHLLCSAQSIDKKALCI